MHNRLLRTALFAGFCLSGMAALIYEVVWTRNLSTVMGSSTYALSTMLAAFMAGLALGGWIGSIISVRTKNLPMAFAFCELGIGIAGLLTIPIINMLTPVYMISFYTFHLSFNTFSFVQFLICFTIMGVPTTLMGMTFPIMMKIFAHPGSDVGKETGRLYSANTFGAIIGSISAGFLLIPMFGGMATALVAASINITTALVILLLSKRYQQTTAAILMAALFLSATAFIYKPALPFFSYYSAQRFPDYKFAKQVLDYMGNSAEDYIVYKHEGTDGSIYLTRSPNPANSEYTLINNGKYEGGDEVGFALLAYLPFITHEKENRPLKALNIGLGSGHTLRNLSQLPFEKIDSIELSQGIIEANQRYLSPDLFNNPKIQHHKADGRNYMLLGPETYDVIVASPSWAVETASAGMLTDEFFSLAYHRLHWHGVFAVWLDDFVETEEEINIILRTIRRNFEHVELWETKGGKVLVGSKSPMIHSTDMAYERLRKLAPQLIGHFRIFMSEEEIFNNLPPGPINTDDKPLIEFRNARNIIKGPENSNYR